MTEHLNAILNKVVNWKNPNHPDIRKILLQIHALDMGTESKLDSVAGVFYERVLIGFSYLIIDLRF